MSLSLSKGENLSLEKTEPGLKNVLIGLGWDPRGTDGADFDLDASAFLLIGDQKVRDHNDFVFFNQKTSGCGSVIHTGDNRTGEGEGDDEQLKVDLSRVPEDVSKIVITVTIYDHESRRQNFGQVDNAFIRIVNDDTGSEIMRYDLKEDYSTETAMVFGELYRNNGEWKFRAVGQGYAGGLKAMTDQFGLNLS